MPGVDGAEILLETFALATAMHVILLGGTMFCNTKQIILARLQAVNDSVGS